MKNVFLFILLFPFVALADPGVVIDVKGDVTVTQGAKATKASAGAQFSDGATIKVAQGSSASLMFSSGAVKKLASGETYTAAKAAPGQPPSENPIVKGIAMAYNDAKSNKGGPVVHGMVKAAPGKQPGMSGGETTLSSARKAEMDADLGKINSLGLGHDGASIMKAQVYYKYAQYQKMADTLLPVYKSQHPPADMVKKLLALGYDRMGKPAEAAKYR